jgi:hypothetical protein
VLRRGKGSVEAIFGDGGTFEDPLPVHLLIGDDLPHVERCAWHPRAMATLRPTERYTGVMLRPGRLLGGPPEMPVLGVVQDDAIRSPLSSVT